ncbi:DUF1330 domain-containing protein [Antrihabitans cavernicola]|uniref:DUF1330 domain-containing protein n=1 Tax=Antrihabitans cavernicola TaxID=2495913 RepID=A0A5A7SBN5_9NOCA|nr:DUF1330 domain-containing protein [Spelaeibacter cavernicola]KAA0021885.1 DUF1330 domain-containing protein [Spelaeibacter cavernicola]
MSAYVISEVRIRDESLAGQYMKLAAASIEKHGGRYVVRGAEPVVAEGDWDDDRRVVVVEFPDMKHLEDWYASSDYVEALKLRKDAVDRRLLFVHGVAPSNSER